MEMSCTRKIYRFMRGLSTVILVATVIFSLYEVYNLGERHKALQNTVLRIEESLDDQKTDSTYSAREMEISYNLSDQVSTSLGIITVGVAIFTVFGGILSIFNIVRSKELENAMSKAEKALESQQELNGARLLQDGLVYVSRHRPYYALKAFEKVIEKAPNTTAALRARFEILLLYADTKNSEQIQMTQECFNDLVGALGNADSKIDSEVCCHLRGDAYFILGCAYGQLASSYNPPDSNHIETSIEYLRLAIQCSVEDVEYHKNLACTYAIANKIDWCRNELEVAIDCAKREPLNKEQVSQKRLRALFDPIWDRLSIRSCTNRLKPF